MFCGWLEALQIKAFSRLNCPQQTSSFSFCFLPPLNSGGAVRAVFAPFGFRDEHSPAHRTVFQILVTVNLRFHHPVQAARPPSGTTCSRRRMYSYADRRRCRHRPAQCSFHCHSYSTPGVSGCWPASSAPESCGRRNRPACVPAATGIDRVFLSCCPSVVFFAAVLPEKASCLISATCSGVGVLVRSGHGVQKQGHSTLPRPGYSFSDGHSVFKGLVHR